MRIDLNPRPRLSLWAFPWFLFLVLSSGLVACDDGDADASMSVLHDDAEQRTNTVNADADSTAITNATDKPIILPNLNAQTVITTSTISIKNKAEYANAKHLPYANPDATKGGELAMSALGSFNSLNPFVDVGVPATGTFYLYDTLMTGSLDESGVMYPQLAQKVTYDEQDKSWVIYHLNPHAYFWDGSPVQAVDVKATFDAILSEGLMSWRGFLAGIKSIHALDGQQVLFLFEKDANPDLFASVGMMPVFAKKDIDKRFTQVSLKPLLGSGAYQVGKVEPSRMVQYVKDKEYWADKPQAGVMANVGRFNFDKLTFWYYQDEAVAFEAFKAGQFNLHTEQNINRWVKFEPSSLPHARIIKAKIPHTNPVTMQGLVMNIRKPWLGDVKVRQALNLAFDWQWVNERLFYGEYQRLSSYFYGSQLAAVGKPSKAELQVLQELPLNDDERTALMGVADLPISDGDGVNRANLLKARQLLLSAGFGYHKGKLYRPDGTLARLEILVQDDKHDSLILAYLTHLKRLGFDAYVRKVDSSSYLNRKRAFDYDMIVDSFMQGNSPGAEQRYLWGSQAAHQTGNQNSIGVSSLAVDEVIDRLVQASSREEIVLYAKVLDRLLLAGWYMIPWGSENTTNVMYHDDITPPPVIPSASIGLDYWYHNAQAKP